MMKAERKTAFMIWYAACATSAGCFGIAAGALVFLGGLFLIALADHVVSETTKHRGGEC